MLRAMGDTVARAVGLVKDYGRVRALDGVDLAIERGEIFGFLGPNGAGKSTTIRLMLSLLRPTAGRAELFGADPGKDGAALRARVGYLPGELKMPSRQTAGEWLRYLGQLRGGRGEKRIGALAERFELDLERPIRSLSKGNKQKVGVVQAFMHEPELLILDEPTSGLDPLLQREFLMLAREAREAGTTVFLSSHVLKEVDAVADRVAIIRSGKIVDTSDIASLRANAGQRVSFVFAEAVDADAFAKLSCVDEPQVEGTTLRCRLRGEADALLKAAASYRVLRFSASELELDDLFLDLYENGRRDQDAGQQESP